MASWDFSNLGASLKNGNALLLKQLLECCGVDFSEVHGTETGTILKQFKPDFIGNLSIESINPIDIYMISNKYFRDVYIYFEKENGNNTSDYYYRYEEIYNPKNNLMYYFHFLFQNKCKRL